MASNPNIHLADQWPAPIALTHEADDVFLTLQQEPGFIYAKWKGHITANDVINAAQLSVAIFQATHCPGLLNDKSEASGEWNDANDWLEYEWAPQVIKAGLKYFAYVYSKNMISLYSTRDLIRRLSPLLQIRTFHTHKDAQTWLNQKTNASTIPV